MKYGNRKIVHDGITFDSKRELTRWIELKLMERAGQIDSLQRQVKYQLIPSYPDRGLRGVSYIADFDYMEHGEHVVEDAKGFKTKDYIIKKKLMYHVHGIMVKEV